MEGALRTDYAGRRGPLFGLALKTALLTVLTLGLYRFWMKARLRRWYWSAIRPGGHPLEYTGTASEKLLGFLVAVSILAFYIGIVNLILMFLSFSILHNNYAAYAVSFIGVLPILFFARYRARRYILARTRWRGIRFGLEPGAWGYAWRALAHWLVTIISLGLLWPRMTFWLEKYRAERSWFGGLRIEQGGRWTMLYRPFLHVALPLAGIGLLVGWAVLAEFKPGLVFDYSGDPSVWIALLILCILWLVFGCVTYKTESFRRLTNAKSAGNVGFVARPRRWRVLRIYVLGYFLVVLGLLAPFFALGVIVAMMIANNPVLLGEQLGASVALSIASYFLIFIFWSVLRQVFVTMPLHQHFAETLEITGTPALAHATQRGRDEFAEAEGFAEALDVGAAI